MTDAEGRATPLSMGSLPEGYRAVVIGASGAIGGAIAQALTADPRTSQVVCLARSLPDDPIDLLDEASVADAAARVAARLGDIHLLFIASGALSLDGRRPEKALAEIEAETLASQVALNAIGPALVLKHFAPLLARRERSLVAALSARVGSIGDNGLGGWVGYRAAKAALNQILVTAAIELKRKRPHCVVAALHPGTVESPLSRPFRPGGASEAGVMHPEESAARLLSVLDGLEPERSGGFWDYRGDPIVW